MATLPAYTKTPYANLALAYHRSGWLTPIPVSRKKDGHGHPLVGGFTGNDVPQATEPQVASLTQQFGGANIGLRMPDGMIAIDVDHYEGKTGGADLTALEEKLGALPPTISSTSRGSATGPGPSRIMYFWLPEEYRGYKMHDKPAGKKGGIEIIQLHHRHANVFPSVHVKTGKLYRWFTPSNDLTPEDEFPSPTEAALLPVAWAEFLKDKPVSEDAGRALSMSESAALDWMVAHSGGKEMCATTRERYDAAAKAMTESVLAGLFDETRTEVMRMANLIKGGHSGLDFAFNAIRGLYIGMKTHDHKRAGQNVHGDWDRMLTGAINRVAAEMEDEQNPELPCLCDLTAELFADGTMALMGVEDPNSEAREIAARAKVESKAAEITINMDAKDLATKRRAIRDWEPPTDEGSLAEQFASPIPQAPALVDKLVPGSGVTLFLAQYKAGKTVLMVNLIKAITTGEKFLRQFDTTKVEGGVAMWNMEVHPAQLNGWFESIGLPEEAAKNVYPKHLNGSGMDLSQEIVADWAVEWLQERDVKVWIIDPMSKLFQGDENSNTEMNAWFRAVREIAKRAGVDSTVIVHHTGHNAGFRGRGASAIMGDPDALIAYWHGGEHGAIPTGPRYMSGMTRQFGQIEEMTIEHDNETQEVWWNPDAGSFAENKAVENSRMAYNATAKLLAEEGVTAVNTKAIQNALGSDGKGDKGQKISSGLKHCVAKGWLVFEKVGTANMYSLGEGGPDAETRTVPSGRTPLWTRDADGNMKMKGQTAEAPEAPEEAPAPTRRARTAASKGADSSEARTTPRRRASGAAKAGSASTTTKRRARRAPSAE